MYGTNMKLALRDMGAAHYRRSSEAYKNVIAALNEDVPVTEMAVRVASERIPLDRYLAKVREVTETDAYFTAAPIFNIWKSIPLGLTQYHEQQGLTEEQGRNLLERFNAYTWGKNLSLKETYMTVLCKSLETTRELWSLGYDGNPALSLHLNSLLSNSEIQGLDTPAYANVRAATKSLEGMEQEYRTIPKERFRDIFTTSGWKRIGKRERGLDELEPRFKEEVSNLIDPLTELGGAYRLQYIDRHHPELLGKKRTLIFLGENI